MTESLTWTNSLEWTFFQHTFQQIQSIGVQSIILRPLEWNVAGSVLCKNLIVGFSREGTFAQKKHMENQSQTEHVTDRIVFSFHVPDVDDFGSHIARRSASHEEVFLGIRKLGQSEVSNNQVKASWLSEDQVFRFQISMHSLLTMHLIEAFQNRFNNFLCLVRLEFFLGFDLVMQKSSFQQLHNHVKRILRLKYLMKSHAIFVVQSAHDFYLLDQALLPLVLTISSFLGKGLHCKVAATFNLGGQVDRSKVTLANFLQRLELLVETPLVELIFEHFPPLLQIASGLQLEGDLVGVLFEVDGGRVGPVTELEFEIKGHVVLTFGRCLNKVVIIDIDGNITLMHLPGVVRHQQFSQFGGRFVHIHGQSTSVHVFTVDYKQLICIFHFLPL